MTAQQEGQRRGPAPRRGSPPARRGITGAGHRGLRGDLLTYARAVAASVVRPEGLAFLRAVVTAGRTGTPEQVAAALDPRVRDLQAMLDRAAPDDPHLEIGDLFDGVPAPLCLRTLFGFADFTEPYLEDLVEQALALAARPDGPVSRG